MNVNGWLRIGSFVILSVVIFFALWCAVHFVNYEHSAGVSIVSPSPWVEENGDPDSLGTVVYGDSETLMIPGWREDGTGGKRAHSTWDVVAHAQKMRNAEMKRFFTGSEGRDPFCGRFR